MTTTDDHAIEAADPDCLDPTHAADLLRDAPWRRMVVIGDSVAAGIREPRAGYRDACFADRVGAALGATRPAFTYRNLGVRDLRLAEIRDGQVPAALALRPDLTMIAAGGNDTLRRTFDPERVHRDLVDITTPLADAGAFVVTIGLFDLPRSGLLPPEIAATMTDRLDRLDELTAAVATQVGGLHVDTHHHPRSTDPAIYAGDRMHANAAGHAIAFAAIVRALATRRIGR
jgi:lysophospholipase L1-like esterase